MRLIDGDALKKRLVKCVREGVNLNFGIARFIETAPTIVEFEGDINKVIVKGEEYHKQLTTTWLGDFSPYQCKHCGRYVDSKTRYCPDCGRRASNYEG